MRGATPAGRAVGFLPSMITPIAVVIWFAGPGACGGREVPTRLGEIERRLVATHAHRPDDTRRDSA